MQDSIRPRLNLPPKPSRVKYSQSPSFGLKPDSRFTIPVNTNGLPPLGWASFSLTITAPTGNFANGSQIVPEARSLTQTWWNASFGCGTSSAVVDRHNIDTCWSTGNASPR